MWFVSHLVCNMCGPYERMQVQACQTVDCYGARCGEQSVIMHVR